MDKKLINFDSNWIIDHILDGLIIFDNNVCININKVALKFLQFNNKDEILGLKIDSIIGNLEDVKKLLKVNIDTVMTISFINKEQVIKKETSIKKVEVEGKKFILLQILGDRTIKLEEKASDSLIQHDKMAVLGESISNIAHQWREPLMEISSLLMQWDLKLQLNKDIDEIELASSIKKSNEIIKFLSQTIDDFKNFYSKNKKKERFNVAKEIGFVISLINTSLKSENINIEFTIKENLYFVGIKNEFLQVILNILVNAQYVLIKLKNVKRYIKITIGSIEGYIIISLEDNGGGIEVVPINKIFQPYFSTKANIGTGMGLFMSKVIIEKNMNGSLGVENTKEGAKFIIKLPKEIT